jgi:hypothetical protein
MVPVHSEGKVTDHSIFPRIGPAIFRAKCTIFARLKRAFWGLKRAKIERNFEVVLKANSRKQFIPLYFMMRSGRDLAKWGGTLMGAKWQQFDGLRWESTAAR